MKDDVRIPADSPDQLTTDARTAQPPVDFNVTRLGTSNLIAITDRQAVSGRMPTKTYRVYFLPNAFVSNGVSVAAIRQAGRNVASLVTTVDSLGRGTVLNFTDTVNANQAGYYYCVAVNRSGVEGQPEHVFKAPTL